MKREIILVIWESIQTSELLFSEATIYHNRNRFEGQLVFSCDRGLSFSYYEPIISLPF